MKNNLIHKFQIFITILAILLAGFSCQVEKQQVRVVDKPGTEQTNDFYVANRPPLLPSPFIKLPIGAIKPQGWALKQLD